MLTEEDAEVADARFRQVFARRVKAEREARSWRRERLAVEIYVTPRTVENWEKGKMLPRGAESNRIALAFGPAWWKSVFEESLELSQP